MNTKPNGALSRLCMLKDDDANIQKDFDNILSFLQVNGVGPKEMTAPSGTPAPLREDTECAFADREGLLALAPNVKNGMIVVPKTLEDGQ